MANIQRTAEENPVARDEWLGGQFSAARFFGKSRGAGRISKSGFNDVFLDLEEPVKSAQKEAVNWALNFAGRRNDALVQASDEVAKAARALSDALAHAQDKMNALKAVLATETTKTGIAMGLQGQTTFDDLAKLIVRHWCEREPFPKGNKGDHGLLGLLEWWHDAVYSAPISKRDALIGELRKWRNAGYRHS